MLSSRERALHQVLAPQVPAHHSAATGGRIAVRGGVPHEGVR